MTSNEQDLARRAAEALHREMPPILRWAGSIARQLRKYNVALDGKSSGSKETDALTLADLTLQELIVSALRDGDPVFRQCRLQAEEDNGDLAAFAQESPLTIALDPIDGTKAFRDHTGDGYSVMLHLRNESTVLASLVFIPECGPNGTWVQANGDQVKCGPDNPRLPALQALQSLPAINPGRRPASKKIYLIGFQARDRERAERVTAAGLEGVPPDDMPGSVYPLLATGEFGGSLIHSPNIYDFPVSLQIARAFGGDSVWVHNGQAVHFREMWMDDRADMLRLPGIVATAVDRNTLETLIEVARDWSQVRYEA